VTQLACRGEAAILGRDDHRLSGIERGAYLACITVAQPGARPTTGDEAAIMETGEARVISVLEGGYALESLARSATAHISALMQG
jgi:acetoin utilization deacetylase AcuC-like enzyme